MTTPEALNALADRVEREEPSLDLNACIYVACGGPSLYGELEDGRYAAALLYGPEYTTSLDAAVTLYKRKPEVISSDPRKVCAEALRQWT